MIIYIVSIYDEMCIVESFVISDSLLCLLYRTTDNR